MSRLRVAFSAVVIAAGLALTLAPVTPLAKNNLAPPPAAPNLPATVLGLGVTKEDVAKTVAQDHRPLYVTGVWMYSLRQGKELMATLEIGKFRSDAPWQSGDFSLSLADQLGGSVPAVSRLGGVPVYISSARGVQIVSWSRAGYLNILAIRNTFRLPKDLVRQLLEVAP